MINRIIEASLAHRTAVLLGTLVVILVGTWSATRLPIDAVPDITHVQVQINTEVPALAPEEIEKHVTIPLELEMSGIPGMTDLRSLSKFGLSQITLIFEDGTDIYRARQLVNERLQNATDELPEGLTPMLAPISTGLGEIFYYVVDYKSDATNKPASRFEQLMELSQIQEMLVKPILRTIPGVAEINTSGGYEKQIVVMPDPERLFSANISFPELATVIEHNMGNVGGGAIEVGGEQIIIRALGGIQTMDEIGNLPVKFGATAEPIRIRDVATIGVGAGQRTGSATWNGEECVLGTVMMLTGDNSRLVSSRVAERLIDVNKALPVGVSVTTGYDRTVLVNSTIATVERNLFEGAILVMVILFLLLGNVRAAVIVSLAIPLSFLIALTGMVAFGVSGNLMSLGAVDFGLIIDGAVVMVENVLRRLGLRRRELGRDLTPVEREETVLAACKEVRKPVFFGELIILIVYLPILSLGGIEGKMFNPMAMTVLLALIGAMVLSLTLLPVLCARYLSRHTHDSETRIMRAASRIYSKALTIALRLRVLVVLAALGLCVGSVLLFRTLGAEFVPQLDEGSFATHMIRTTSIGLDAAIDMQRRSERVLLEKFPEVDYVFSRIGTSEVAMDPMGVNVADMYVFFAGEDKWRQEGGEPISKDRLAGLMSDVLTTLVPGQAILFSQPIEMRFNEMLEGTRADISVKVSGEDYDKLEAITFQVQEILKQIPGAADVGSDSIGKAPMLEIRLKADALTKFDIHADEVTEVIQHGMAGADVGLLVEGNRRFPIVIRMDEALRQQMDTLKALPIRTEDGGLIRLEEVADLTVSEKVNAIARDFSRRRAAIMINLRGRDVESFVLEAQRKVAEAVELPPGYSVEFGGQFKNLQDAQARLSVIVPVALIVIFALIYAAFGSLKQALVVYTGIPLAVTGGVIALWLRGMPFSISAAIGFIALSGVAVLNGVVMITCFNQLRAAGQSLRSAVLEGSLTRLRPVMMTALVASFGFIPMALGHGAGAEVQRPLATVVIGGILTSTFLTLVLLPILYMWIEGFGRSVTNNKES